MLRVAHREGKRVVRQHGFDPIRQRLDDPLEKPCRGEARLIEANPNDRFAAKVIDGGKLVVVPSISEGRQELNIDVDQLARPLLLVPLRAGRTGRGRRFCPTRSSTRWTVPRPQPNANAICAALWPRARSARMARTWPGSNCVGE
jgi:hypothetical protein